MENNLNSQNFIETDNGEQIPNLIEQGQQEKKSNRSFSVWLAIVLLVSLVIIGLNTFVFIYTDVVGGSMLPTLESGDRLVASKYKDFKVGSIVVIEGVDGDDKLIIKRVIALEGDTVEIKENNLYVNGKLLSEPYAKGPTEPKGWHDWAGNSTSYTLKENEVFYLGDNRAISLDARTSGPCKEEQIIAVITDWSLWLNDLFN